MYVRVGLALGALALLTATASVATAQDHGLRDPTRPPSAAGSGAGRSAAAREHFDLQSTLVAPGRVLAVINGQTVGTGDRILGATVLEIRPSAVVLKRDGRRITLSLLSRRVATEEVTKLGAGKRDHGSSR